MRRVEHFSPLVSRFTDVAIVPGHGGVDPRLIAQPPVGVPPVELGPGLTLEQLDPDDAHAFFEACESRGLNFRAHRQFSQQYAFVLRGAVSSDDDFRLYNWDAGNAIAEAIRLSRCIVLNAHCPEYAARRLDGVGAESVQIVPLGYAERWYAWQASDPSRRDWLTEDDARALRRLLDAYAVVREQLPKRVQRAMVRCEMSFRTPYIETATVEVVSALESLLSTRRHQLTDQFATRVPALAQRLGFVGVTKRVATHVYRERSRSVHGQPSQVTAGSPAARRLRAMQLVLLAAVRQSIETPGFRALFRTAGRVEQAWGGC